MGSCPACGCAAVPKRSSVTLRPCSACGTLFLDDVPSEAALKAYYNSAYVIEPAEISLRRSTAWSDLVDYAELHVGRGRALEVGSSSGHFLRLLDARGWRAAGVEVDARAREVHTRRSPEIPVYAALNAASDGGWKGLDLIVALHTIEHLPVPRAFLKSVHECLREGGVLVLTTPNGGSIVRWLTGPCWEWWTPPAHLELFTCAGLLLALRESGFEVLEIRTRRGDANGTAANVLLGPFRGLKRRLRGLERQAVSPQSAGRRLSGMIDAVFDPITAPLRRRAYAALLGPELLVIARAISA